MSFNKNSKQDFLMCFPIPFQKCQIKNNLFILDPKESDEKYNKTKKGIIININCYYPKDGNRWVIDLYLISKVQTNEIIEGNIK